MNNKSFDKKVILIASLVFIVIMYFIIPPYNKLAQIGYCINNVKFYLNLNKPEAFVFHRNNAIYLARMNNSSGALNEINKAISIVPSSTSEEFIYDLYRDRANIRLFYGDHKGALTDYLKIPNHSINDYLKIAMLLKENGKRRLAVSYCNKIIDIDIKAYAGYACIADVYGSAGKFEASVMIYDLLIDRVPNKAKYYADRAMYKRKAGDNKGADSDLKYAQELSPILDVTSSITYDALHPKKLELSIL